jgi:UPF0755 protein
MSRLFFCVVGLLVAVFVSVAGLWLHHELTSPYYAAANAETLLEIPRGTGVAEIAARLVEAKVLHSKYPFILYVRWAGHARRMQAGEYRFASPATPVQIADKIKQGKVYYLSITIPEGLTAEETIQLIGNARLGSIQEMRTALSRTEWVRDIAPEAGDLEGFLFPNTYRFSRRINSEEIIRTLVNQFKTEFARLTTQVPIPTAWTASHIVTLASLIEKEVRIDSERPLVASVLRNRLRIGMPLACDPTIIYAMKLAGNYDGNLRKEDMSLQSPYNTYIHQGLPPGPIANPGEASLRAALSPAQSKYLYYVSRNDGTHLFSEDFRSHQAGVMRYQKRAAQGRPRTP